MSYLEILAASFPCLHPDFDMNCCPSGPLSQLLSGHRGECQQENPGMFAPYQDVNVATAAGFKSHERPLALETENRVPESS